MIRSVEVTRHDQGSASGEMCSFGDKGSEALPQIPGTAVHIQNKDALSVRRAGNDFYHDVFDLARRQPEVMNDVGKLFADQYTHSSSFVVFCDRPVAGQHDAVS